VDRIIEAAAGSVPPGDLGAAARALLPELSAKARSGLEKFLQVIEAGRGLLSPEPEKAAPPAKRRRLTKDQEGLTAGEGLSVCVVKLIQDSGIGEYHLAHDEAAGNQRLNNLQELANAASLYEASTEGLLEFLEHIELDRSIEDNAAAESKDGAVTLITFHNTKGLEFRRVIMTGIEQGVFPREDKKDEELEEERRLFYVGATRAMDELYLSSCAARRMYGRTVSSEPSLFLREIDQSALRIIGNAPYGFKTSGRASGQSAGAVGKRSSDGKWRLGDRIFHDDHGYGAVVEIREGDEGPIIRVRFETGHETRFLSAFQSAAFVKIGDD
jgi:DNA helicase-2/ATP-dependent DNA helicase PcrA